MDWTAQVLFRESHRKEEAASKKKKRERRGLCAGSGASPHGGRRERRQRGRHHLREEDTQVRQLARSKLGALGMSMMVQMILQTGETAGSWGRRTGCRSAHPRVNPLENLAAEQPALQGRPARARNACRSDGWARVRLPCSDVRPAVEAANTEEGGWAWARHLKVLPRQRCTTTTPDMRAAKGDHAVAGKVVQEISEAIEDRGHPDPDNNVKGGGGRGAPLSAIMKGKRKGKPAK